MTITAADISSFEDSLNQKLAVHNAQFKMTVHFSFDRLNDPRNNPPITMAELKSIFERLLSQHLNAILVLDDNDTFNIKCTTSHINMPCGVRKVSNPNNGTITQKNVVITVMRKKGFFAKDKIEFKV